MKNETKTKKKKHSRFSASAVYKEMDDNAYSKLASLQNMVWKKQEEKPIIIKHISITKRTQVIFIYVYV